MARPKAPGPMATFLSDIQLFLSGLALSGLGASFIVQPALTLEKLSPALRLIEANVPQARAYPVCQGLSASLSQLGATLFLVGFLMLMSVYTNDEKFKRNSTPCRVIAAFAFAFTVFKTPHGTSLHALLGAFFGVTGVLNALTVGMGDGNAVDLEVAEARRVRLAKKAKQA